jgi:hypothetical protein
LFILYFLSYDATYIFNIKKHFVFLQRSPSQAVSIRAIEHDKYKVIDKLNNRLLEEIEESKAFFQVRVSVP